MSTDLEAFRAEVRAWIANHKPEPPAFKLPQSFLEVESDQQFHFLRAWQKQVYEAGYLGFDVPAEYGGRGVDRAKQAIVSQELARAHTPFLVNVIGLQWAGPTILVHGTDAQKRKYLPGLLSGDEIWCQGFSEPGFGSDLAGLQARAVKTAGGWEVTGHKVWTTLAHVSRWMILLARTDPAANKYEGLSYFLFPMDAPGVTVEPLVKMTGEGGFNQVLLDHAPMPADALLGVEGAGWKVAMTTLMFERGAADSANRERAQHDLALFDRVVELARKTTRDGAPVADDAVFRDRIAQLWIEVEALRLGAMRTRTAALCADHPGALAFSHKLVYSEWMQRLGRLATEALGPDAMLWLGDAHAPDKAEWPRAYMNSYGFTIGGGTSEIQRNILGERVLGLPKSK
jgi:alkylation response protein AidB-like acyl-CoA dehydrogenase